MRRFTARFLLLFLSFIAVCSAVLIHPSLSLAQGLGNGTTPTPAPGSAGISNWVYSPEVTEVGKNADRARQLLFWVMSHPPVYSAPVISEMWAVTRNVAYAFVVLTIIMFAVGFVMAQRRGGSFNGISLGGGGGFGSIIFKLAVILLYITFSYILVLLIIQLSEVIMRFFIERVGGSDLFNIVFAGDSYQNTDKNYTDFRGFWDTNPNNYEMRNTSLFFVKLTSITYNVMAIMLILRHVILWFLLIISPFLALLMPFIFIRNTGWIWIGVFFQWIFYGPLFAVFLAALAKIWKAGIPYGFDYSRVERMVSGADAPVYPTSINILWGGPAQVLRFHNSANYVDTYAEYVISLIMLWTATFLPWLLLRIFRDYCCEILAQNQATLVQILDKVRGLGTPPPPPKPTPVNVSGQMMGTNIDLPFRNAIEQPQKAFLSKLANIQQAQTREIAQALNFSIASIQDIAEYDMNQNRQSQTRSNLDSLRNPASLADTQMREQFSSIKGELMARAARGDNLARRVVSAAERRSSDVFRSQSSTSVRTMTTPDVAKTVGVPEATVKTVLQSVPLMGVPSVHTIQAVSQKTGVPVGKVNQILAASRPQAVAGRPVSDAPSVSVDDYEEVKSMWLSHYKDSDVPVSENIKDRHQWLEEDVKKLTNVLNMVTSVDAGMKQKGIEEVGAILPFLLLGGFSEVETVMYLKAKLAAAQQTLTELEAVEKAKVGAKEEPEEEFVEIEKSAKKEEAKTFEAQQVKEMDYPFEKEEPKGSNEPKEPNVSEEAKQPMEKPQYEPEKDPFNALGEVSTRGDSNEPKEPKGTKAPEEPKEEDELIELKEKEHPEPQARPLDEGLPEQQEKLEKEGNDGTKS